MKRVIIALACIVLATTVFAQNEQETVNNDTQKNAWGAKLRESNFHLGLDLQTKYMWRGMEMMTEEAAPVLFPCVNYSNKGFYAYVMGGYAVNGKYAEVDLGLSYTYKWFTIGVNDYYYPTTIMPQDQYFNFKPKETGHWLEAVVTIAPEKIPAYLTVSNFFYGADKKIVVDAEGNPSDKQAYSTYAEIGTYYDFLKDNRLSLAVGAAFNKSCYNGYDKDFSVCNIELKYTYTATIKDFSFPLNIAYIINPVYEKSFVNFSTSFAF